MAKRANYKQAFETLVNAIQYERDTWQDCVDISSASYDAALDEFDFAQANAHFETMARHKALVEMCDKLLFEAAVIRTQQTYDVVEVKRIALQYTL